MARDYYGLLGREQGRQRFGDQARLPQAGARTASRRQPRRGRAGEVQGDQRRLRGAERPGEAPHRRPRRRPAGERAAAAGNGFGGFGGLGDVFEAFFGGGADLPRPDRPGPAGSDSLLRMRLDLAECATGVTKQVTVDTAVLCDLLPGQGHQRQLHADRLRHLRRPRRGADRAALAARPGDDVAAVPDLPRRRRGHPRPVPPVRRRRPGAGPPRDQRQDPGRRRRRHAGPAGRPGRGRPRRRTGGRPVRRGPRAAARHLRPRRRRPALHHLGADGRRRAGHHGHRRRDPRRPDRDHHPGGHPAGFGRPRCAATACRICAPGCAATCTPTSRWWCPSRLDHQDTELLRKLKEHRSRDAAEVKSTQRAAPAAGCSAGCAKPSPAARAPAHGRGAVLRRRAARGR